MKRVWRGSLMLLALVATSGCGTKEKAQMYLALNANTEHPEFFKAMQKTELAEIVALLNLSPDQAQAMKGWADGSGAKVRQSVSDELVTNGQAAPAIAAAADELVKQKASTVAKQGAVLEETLQDKKKLLDSNPKDSMDLDKVLESHKDELQPLAAGLSDRQQLVLLGHWKTVSEAVAGLLTLKDAAQAHDLKEKLASAVGEARAYDGELPPKLKKKLQALISAIPTGQDTAAAAEKHTAALFNALPSKDGKKQAEDAMLTLGAVLCLEPASGLLALVS